MNKYPAFLESSACHREAKQGTLVGLKEVVVTVVWWESEEWIQHAIGFKSAIQSSRFV
jgi:hypothetical protein